MAACAPRRSPEALASARRALAEPPRPRGRARALLAAALLMALSGAGAAAAMILGPGASEAPAGVVRSAAPSVGFADSSP